ncbi:MAG TPA: LON peptidase substrate-binding domain-containing protein [Polyangiaceae bacterium]|nr:LON peptidase substrate-binding domain-containing protein [Polyangiaceae bacterium]
MKRELPNRPNLEHLKTQAKDLLDAHRNRDPGALQRIREALPAFAGATDDQIVAGPFALHDAQSVIAREYGFPSFAKLRARVLFSEQPHPTELIARLMGTPLPAELEAAIREAFDARDLDALDALPTPDELAVVAVRNALVSPGALAPLAIGRPSSMAALHHATEKQQHLVALFAQREQDVEQPTAADLHATGCLAIVRKLLPTDEGPMWVVLEGVRWITLLELTLSEPFLRARVAVTEIDEGESTEISALDGELRDAARRLAQTLPQKDAALAMIDAIVDPSRLSDLVIANLPCSVAEKAAYAAEPVLAVRLRSTIAFLARELAKAG